MRHLIALIALLSAPTMADTTWSVHALLGEHENRYQTHRQSVTVRHGSDWYALADARHVSSHPQRGVRPRVMLGAGKRLGDWSVEAMADDIEHSASLRYQAPGEHDIGGHLTWQDRWGQGYKRTHLGVWAGRRWGPWSAGVEYNVGNVTAASIDDSYGLFLRYTGNRR